MLVPALAFSLTAAAFVWWAGRRDHAKDPRLTLLALVLLLTFPLLFCLRRATPFFSLALVITPRTV